jgi:hypothetical protein
MIAQRADSARFATRQSKMFWDEVHWNAKLYIRFHAGPGSNVIHTRATQD